MKKLLIFVLIFILTGCGNRCEREFESVMTKNYSKNAKRCEVVKYTEKKSNIEIITTPSKDKKSFTAKVKIAGFDVLYGYSDILFTNAKLKQYNGINFLELYDTSKKNNTYLILFDEVGNIRYETPASISPVVSGNNFTMREYRTFVDGDYDCTVYSNLDAIAYVEKTYNMLDMSLLDSKEFKIKDVCK